MAHKNQSSNQRLSQIVATVQTDETFTPKAAHVKARTIERNMEAFDRKKREKTAKSEERLGRIIITG